MVSSLPPLDAGQRGDGSVVVVVFVSPGAGLRLEGAIQGGRVVEGDVVALGNAAVVGDENDTTILVDDPNRPALEDVAVLTEDVTLHPIVSDGFTRQDEDVAELLDRDEQPQPLSGPIAPDAVLLVVAIKFTKLIGQRNVERHGLTPRFDDIGESADL